MRDDTDRDRLFEEISEAIRSLMTIKGVEGIGKPVTVISPGDLLPEFLGFIERLRAGAIELDEEMILVTIRAGRGRRWKKNPFWSAFAGYDALSAAMRRTAGFLPRK
jgi:hypothetical protein